MELKELFTYRQQLLSESKDDEGYISDAGFIDFCLQGLNDAKLIDTTDVTDIYCAIDKGAIKVNSYTLNESGERLQLFLVDEGSLTPDATEEEILVSQKGNYEKQFSKSASFLKKSIKRQLDTLLQDGAPAWILVHQLGSSSFIDQIDVVEIFLLSASATVERRGSEITTKVVDFDDEFVKVNFTRDSQQYNKQIAIKRKLIDLNFLYKIYQTTKGREPLHIDFSSAPYHYPLPFLHAAEEKLFDSYLCAIPATLLAKLYFEHSSRLLEKNVRSFLQLNNSVNKGMQDTIRKKPEKFIAFNNGLTITATASEIHLIKGIPHLKSLTDFQIVNGGQTTATIYFSQKSGLLIDGVRVMAKINVAKEASDEILDELISEISTYSNAQSKVSKVDLRARSSQLVKIKSLSESVHTVTGKKWFFERAKGEFATMLRINSKRKPKIEKDYPKDRRFTKEEMAKYYAAWGNQPYAVKKGGEKIFRLFIEEISGEGKFKKALTINRSFYEDLISRIILFRSLEKIYGSGNSSLGQLRSVVVPYSLSALFAYTTGDKKSQPFDLLKIWKAEKIEEELVGFFKELMQLMNGLVKKYSKSDDFGEYSKKQELWDDIVDSSEMLAFMDKASNKKILNRYLITQEELKKREKESAKSADIDFEPLLDVAAIFDKGSEFYRYILNSNAEVSASKSRKLETIISAIKNTESLDKNIIEFESKLLNDLAVLNPDALIKVGEGDLYTRTATYLARRYNLAIEKGESPQSAFNAIKEIAKKKEAKYYSVFGEIGRSLENHILPDIKQLRQASEYVRLLTN